MANGFYKNTHRVDPYKNFKFRVLIDKDVVMGVSKVTALKRTTEVVKFRSGGENSHDSKSPGRTSYEAITLERGVTHDAAFEEWASQVHDYAGDPIMNLLDYKKDLTLEVLNERGQVAIRYFLYRCWVSEYQALPDLDANANAVAIQHLKIEMNGWKRDPDTKEPDEKAAV